MGMGLVENGKPKNGLHQRIHVTRNGRVYDVTDFANRHPGGKDILLKHLGQDISKVMEDEDIHFHSKAAYTILEKYYIGPEGALVEENGNYKEASELFARQDDYYKQDIIDWDKPLLGQVEYLGDKYFDWTHQQVDRPIRLFHSDFLEMFSKAPWWMVPLTWVPVVTWSLCTAYATLAMRPAAWPRGSGIECGPLSIPLIFGFGVLAWTILEYVIHRWVFHLRPPAQWPSLVRLHFSLHGQHHKSPMDPMRLVFPPAPAAIFGFLFYWGSQALFPAGVADCVFAGIVSGYMAYDLTHYYIHHGQPPLAYFQRLKKYHTLHHYQHQQLGFGISSKLWDYPFGTLIPETKKKQ